MNYVRFLTDQQQQKIKVNVSVCGDGGQYKTFTLIKVVLARPMLCMFVY